MDFLQSTARRVVLKAYLASDHITAATGKTIAVVISKNGGAFGNPNAGATNATAISNGWYYVDLDTTDTGTLGPLIVRGTEGTIDDVEVYGQVVLAVPAVNTTQVNGTAQTAKDLGAINVTNLNTLSGHDPGATIGTSTLTQTQVTGGAYSVQSSSCVLGDARIAHLDADVSTRMATYTQPTGFLAATFPTDPADQSLVIAATDAIMTRLGTPADTDISTDVANAQTDLTAVRGKTDNLPIRVVKGQDFDNFMFPMFNSSRELTTGLTVAAQRIKDNGSITTCTNAVSEVGSTGIYRITLVGASDLNADTVLLLFTATGALDHPILLVTQQ